MPSGASKCTGCEKPSWSSILFGPWALARLAVGHEPLVGRQDGDPHATQDARYLARRRVHAQSRLRDAAQTRDRPPPVGGVLQHDPELAAGAPRVVVDREA